MKYISLLTLWFLLVACDRVAFIAPAPTLTPTPVQGPSPYPSDFMITLERTECFGFCPAYAITIDDNGNVLYEGRANVAVTGKHATIIGREKVQQLVEAFDEAQFFTLEDNEGGHDMAKVSISLQMNGRSKHITWNSKGYNSQGNDLDDVIERIVNTDQWVKKP